MKSLLIIIDLQRGWRHKIATEPAMLRTVELGKKFDGDVIHCRFKNSPNSQFQTLLNWYRFTEPIDTDEIPEIAALNLPSYWRSTYSCLTAEVKQLIKDYEMIYIAGVFTDISVSVTAMVLFDAGHRVSIVTDCVATLHGETVHKAALKALNYALSPNSLITSVQLLN